MFWNRGRGRAEGRGQNLSPPTSPLSPQFVPVPPEKCGKDIFKPIVGRGSAFADIDGDGDLDVVMTQIGGPPLLLRNDQRLNHHWLRIKLVGTKSNRDGIGAWVRVRVGNAYGGSVTLARQVMPTKSYLSQSEAPVTFGLSSASRVEEVTVTWPGGSVQRVSGLKIDASNLVKQP